MKLRLLSRLHVEGVRPGIPRRPGGARCPWGRLARRYVPTVLSKFGSTLRVGESYVVTLNLMTV